MYFQGSSCNYAPSLPLKKVWLSISEQVRYYLLQNLYAHATPHTNETGRSGGGIWTSVFKGLQVIPMCIQG